MFGTSETTSSHAFLFCFHAKSNNQKTRTRTGLNTYKSCIYKNMYISQPPPFSPILLPQLLPSSPLAHTPPPPLSMPNPSSFFFFFWLGGEGGGGGGLSILWRRDRYHSVSYDPRCGSTNRAWAIVAIDFPGHWEGLVSDVSVSYHYRSVISDRTWEGLVGEGGVGVGGLRCWLLLRSEKFFFLSYFLFLFFSWRVGRHNTGLSISWSVHHKFPGCVVCVCKAQV